MIDGDVALGAITWPEAGKRANSLLAVPIGSTEQHGPHLPLDTDTRIAVALARSLGRSRSDLVVAPELAYGASGEHTGFPGTLSIGPVALEMIVVELVRSIVQSFRGAVLVSGHGGNHAAIRRAVDVLIGEGHRVMAWFAHCPSGDAHAGRIETSIMLALSPSVVQLERAAAGNKLPLCSLMDLLRKDGVRVHSENGVIGDPAGASAEEGELLLKRMSDDLQNAVEAKFGPG